MINSSAHNASHSAPVLHLRDDVNGKQHGGRTHTWIAFFPDIFLFPWKFFKVSLKQDVHAVKNSILLP